MTTTALLIAFAVLVALTLLWATRRYSQPLPDLLALEGYTRRVDLAAFRNLIDPAEEGYLRERLSARQFRAVQRRRMRAALEYVGRTAHNAAILLRVAGAARRDRNPEVAAAARELENDALLLIVNARLATLVLYARILMPGKRISLTRVTNGYENLTQDLVRLARLQDPAYATRIAGSI